MKKYIPSSIEPKWQKKWEESRIYSSHLDQGNKYYVLVELAYTSGDLHMGHWFTFSKGDILARFKRMQGYNVIFPNGFDTFGLPAENAALRNNMHPKDWTYFNIERMRKQFGTMGTVIDWKQTAITCDPAYYKWNQWIFLKMLERGIAYRGKAMSNWCPSCQTVLADENVEAGKCWRCDSEVETKEINQWFFKITAYADKLIWPLDSPSTTLTAGARGKPAIDWPKSLRDAQNQWIGKSAGMIISFDGIEVFTTRSDTVYGATFIILSPEHPKVADLTTKDQETQVKRYIDQAAKKSEVERKESKEKTGVFTGSYVKNPLTKENIPVWIADYVLMSYGTGAIMAVPGHDERDFEFAEKFNLPIKRVISSKEKLPWEGEGELVDSGEYTGWPSSEARERISEYIESHHSGKRKINYHLHDWSISRQRYWGTPIPIIYCDKCGIAPVPYEDLPIELPEEVDYSPKGKAPLATAEDWVNVKCPKCGGPAHREVETMDGFVDNSWYFYRYLDPENDQEIFNKKIISDWMPVDIYIGGAEHTYGHALYSRFFTKFFKDIGLVKFDEYAKKRVHHGVILGPDGSRMSKSRGNVVNPDEQVGQYGADAVRLYLAFLGPYDLVASWNAQGLQSVYHFLQRIWGLYDKVTMDSGLASEDLRIMHKTIKKVGKDLEELKFNTAIASLMEWLNHLSKKDQISSDEYKTYLLLLAPFAPHMTEELWSFDFSSTSLTAGTQDKEKWSIHQQPWPKYDEKYLQQDQIKIVVQVNGKVRDTIMVEKDIENDYSAVEKVALSSQKVQNFLQGRSVKRSVYVTGKLINLVVSS